MAKNHRGKGLKNLPNHGRGECPECHRTGVKLLYKVKVGEQTKKKKKNCRQSAAQKLSA